MKRTSPQSVAKQARAEAATLKVAVRKAAEQFQYAKTRSKHAKAAVKRAKKAAKQAKRDAKAVAQHLASLRKAWSKAERKAVKAGKKIAHRANESGKASPKSKRPAATLSGRQKAGPALAGTRRASKSESTSKPALTPRLPQAPSAPPAPSSGDEGNPIN